MAWIIFTIISSVICGMCFVAGGINEEKALIAYGVVCAFFILVFGALTCNEFYHRETKTKPKIEYKIKVDTNGQKDTTYVYNFE